MVSLSNQGLEDTPKPLLVKDQSKISRLEKQAEEFLNAVLYRKGEFLSQIIDVGSKSGRKA